MIAEQLWAMKKSVGAGNKRALQVAYIPDAQFSVGLGKRCGFYLCGGKRCGFLWACQSAQHAEEQTILLEDGGW